MSPRNKSSGAKRGKSSKDRLSGEDRLFENGIFVTAVALRRAVDKYGPERVARAVVRALEVRGAPVFFEHQPLTQEEMGAFRRALLRLADVDEEALGREPGPIKTNNTFSSLSTVWMFDLMARVPSLGHRSTYDSWQDRSRGGRRERIVKGTLNSKKFWDDMGGGERRITLQNWRKGFGKHYRMVGNFNAFRAKHIYARLMHMIGKPHRGEGFAVLDMSAGWGDRMLAAMSSPRIAEYYGIDASSETVKRLQSMRDAAAEILSLSPTKVEVVLGVAEDPRTFPRRRTFDICFTSPPYFQRERYETSSDTPALSDSFEVYMRGFVKPMLANSAACLAHGGVLAMNMSTSTVRDGDSFDWAEWWCAHVPSLGLEALPSMTIKKSSNFPTSFAEVVLVARKPGPRHFRTPARSSSAGRHSKPKRHGGGRR